MKITIICVGRLKEKFWKEAVAEYTKRLSRYAKVSIVEVEDEPLPEGASDAMKDGVLSKEGTRIQKCIPQGSHVIALDSHGRTMDSEGFSKYIERLGNEGKSSIAFIIGGSVGLTPEVKCSADLLLSFSDMTFPHQLMRVILAEQIYRAYRIMKNEPYHK